MDAIALLLGFVALCNLALAAVVLRAGAKREANRVFAIAAFAVSGWALTNALFRVADTQSDAVLVAQFSYGAALALAAAFLHFSWVYPQRLARYPMWREKLTVWLLALVVAVSAFAPGFTVQGVDMASRRILTASGVYPVAIYMLLASAAAFFTFYRHQAHLRGRERAQARYVLYGSFLTAIFGLFFNLFLPLAGDYRFVWMGPVSSLFFIGFTLYSIVAHRLFDVKRLIRRTLVYSIVLTLLTVGFTVVEKVMEHLVNSLFGTQDSFATQIMAVLLVGFGVEPVRLWAKTLVHQMLFKGEKDGVE